MHKLERYGVVALVFLLVTILAVSLWSGGEPEDVVARAAAPAAATAPAGSADAAPRPPLSRPVASERAEDADARRSSPASRRGPVRPEPTSTREEAERLLAEARGSGAPGSASPASPRPGPGRTPVDRSPGGLASSSGARAGGAQLTDLVEQRARPAARTEPEPAKASGREVVVRAGDTLSEIAERELGASSRWRDLAAANPGVDPARLFVGAKLRLPADADARPPREAAPPRDEPARESRAADGVYVVRAGDTLSGIAQRQLGSSDRWRQIVAANPGLDPRRLMVGAKLRLPGASAPAAEAREAPDRRSWTNVARWSGSDSKGRVR